MLLVGLGNPGKRYQNNRHNIGFRIIDALVDRYGLDKAKDKFDSELYSGQFEDQKIIAIKPQTYMNLSGRPVLSFAKFYKIPMEEIVVIHDDIDLAPGKVKVKLGGGAGGHNGLKSIDQNLGQNYYRIRFGVGHPGDKDLVADYVLNDFAFGDEKNMVAERVVDIVHNFDYIFRGEFEEFAKQLA